MSALALTIEGGFPILLGQDLARYVTQLTDAERAVAERASGVKHARLVGSAGCFAALAGSALLQRLGPRETGVICTGGPWSLAACSTFINRTSEAGPGLVNPLQFPATLLSAAATIPASLLHAHAFAFVIGHDRLAFFEALHRASSAVDYRLAAQVLVLAVSSGDVFIEAARARAGVGRPSLDVSIAFGIAAESDQATLQLLGVYIDKTAPAHGGTSYKAEWRGDAFVCPIDTPLAYGEAYGASGAVLCIAAARHHAATTRHASTPFSVDVCADGRTATAIFQLTEGS
ncbi:MAG TPA: hypothetical protein VEI03_20585 [Stellaceae bacterium]|nr:hypothetical protein [Stellaceae bacterium]